MKQKLIKTFFLFLLALSFSPNLQAQISANPASFCAGASASVTINIGISGGTSPYTVSYKIGTGAAINKTNYIKGTPISVPIPVVTTTYTVVSIVDKTGTTIPISGSASTIITVLPRPNIPTITASGPTTFCQGESVILTSNAGTVYKWTTPQGIFTTQSITASMAGDYTVQLTNANGCSSITSIAKTIVVNPLPNAPVIETLNQPTCSVNTGSVILSGLPSSGTWTINPGESGEVTGTGTTTTLSNLSIGTYRFIVKNQNGCISDASATITIIAPTGTLEAPGLYNAIVSCNQTSYLLDWTLIDNATNYVLDVATDEGFTTFLTDYYNKELGNVNLVNIQDIIPGIPYYIRLRTVNGCGTSVNSNTIIVKIPTISTPAIDLITSPTCLEDTGSITLSNLPATGNWTINPGAVNGTGTTATLSGLNPGDYQFTVINESGCQSPATVVATIKPKPSMPVTPVLNSQINSCQSSFNQTWQAAENATGYQLDVSANADFSTFLPGYQSKELGNVTSQTVGGIIPGNNYYVRLRAVNNCGVSPNSNSITISPVTTTYDNGTWSNGLPNSAKSIVFNSNYNINADMSGCSCQVTAGANITVQSGITLKLENALDVAETGSLTFENNSSLVQINEAVNIGKIVYKRYTTPMQNFDWTSWSSPVTGYTLYQVSPNTLGDKYNSYDPVLGWQTSYNGVAVMKPGIGYHIRTPKDGVWPNGEVVAFPYTQLVKFTGVPNNGTITTANYSPKQWHLVGNPYPSALNVETFLEENPGFYGTISIPNHNTPITNLKYSPNDNSIYNFLGGIAGAEPGQGVTSSKPTGKIAAGQSFFANTWGSGTITFNNGMRVLGQNSQFYKSVKTKKTAAVEKHRLWLNLTNTTGGFRQILIGYATDATNNYDSRYDSNTSSSTTHIRFYSINLGYVYDIQGRALPFDNADIIPLGYSAPVAGSHTIAIDEVDGLFVDQAVYLEDKTTSTYYNLKDAPYTFSTLVGTFDNRFVIHYINTAITNKKAFISNDLDSTNKFLVFSNNSQIGVNSFTEKIQKISIYDIKGSLIFEKENINNTSFLTDKLAVRKQILIVKTTLENGKINTEKVVF